VRRGPASAAMGGGRGGGDQTGEAGTAVPRGSRRRDYSKRPRASEDGPRAAAAGPWGKGVVGTGGEGAQGAARRRFPKADGARPPLGGTGRR